MTPEPFREITVRRFLGALFILPFLFVSRTAAALQPADQEIRLQFLDQTVDEGRVEGLLNTLDQASHQPHLAPLIQIHRQKDTVSYGLADLGKIVFYREERLTFTSNDASVYAYSLGQATSTTPDPPGWSDPREPLPDSWKPTSLADAFSGWLYIPGAAWIWSEGRWFETDNETVLFRHEFEVPADFCIRRAVFEITADHHLESLYINGAPLPVTRESLVGKRLEMECTSYLRNGPNLLAVKAANDHRPDVNYAGIAYRLRLWGYSGASNPPIPNAPAAVVFLKNGDRLSGDIAKWDKHEIAVKTSYAQISVSLPWVHEILLNYPDDDVPFLQKPSVVEKFSRFFKKATASKQPRLLPALAWRVSDNDSSADPLIELKTGEKINGEVVDAGGSGLVIKPRFGTSYEIAVKNIRRITPRESLQEGLLRYDPRFYDFITRADLINGDRMTGLLQTLDARRLTLETPYVENCDVALNQISSVGFPYHYASLFRKKLEELAAVAPLPPVALIGDASSSEQSLDYDLRAAVTGLLEELGLTQRWIDPIELVTPELFNPQKYPVLVNLDCDESFYHTVREDGDGYKALLDYAKNGGCLIHLARGHPFYYAKVAAQDQWAKTIRTPAINAEMGLDIATIGDKRPNFRTFEFPDNSDRDYRFVAEEKSPLGKQIPGEVEFPTSMDSRFRPISGEHMPADAVFTPIYRLEDSRGTDYGYAMALVTFKRPESKSSFVAYSSHLLFSAPTDDGPMLNYILPPLLQMAYRKN